MISKIKIKTALSCSKFGRHIKWLRSKCGGSLLLEIAIGLSVLSIVSGFFITKTITANRAMRIQKTKNNIEIVTSALAAYLVANNRLPRPSSSDNGLESDNMMCDVGSVPYNTLGIPQKNSMDGNSRPLNYIVDINLTDNFSSIYETELSNEEKYFCKKIINPKIKKVPNIQNNDIIAFVIDTEDNKPKIEDGKIIIKPFANTFWTQRNMLLIQYVKGCPCETATPTLNRNTDDMLDF